MRDDAELSTGMSDVLRPNVPCDSHAVLDLEGRFTVVGKGFAQSLGAEEGDLVGEDLERFIDPETPRAARDALWRALSTGRSWVATIRFRSCDGRVLWMTLTVAPDTHRGVTRAYLAQLRSALGVEIERARNAFAKEAIDADTAPATGSLPWRRVGACLRSDLAAGFVGLAVVLALVAAGSVAVGSELGGLAVGFLVSGLVTLVALAGIGAIVLERRQRRREHEIVCGLVDRISEGDFDAGAATMKGVTSGSLRDALRRLQLKLSIAAYDRAKRKPDSGQSQEPFGPVPALVERLRSIEVRCAELVALSRRPAQTGKEAVSAAEEPAAKRLAALSEGLEALQSRLQLLAQAGRQSRVLGLNLGLLAARSNSQGRERLHRMAMSVARDAADGALLLEQDLERLQRELDALVELHRSRGEPSRTPDGALADAMVDFLEELRVLRLSVDSGRHGLRPVSDVTVGSRQDAYALDPVKAPTPEGRPTRKTPRLRAVGVTPVPRVGRNKRGAPLEDDWLD